MCTVMDLFLKRVFIRARKHNDRSRRAPHTSMVDNQANATALFYNFHIITWYSSFFGHWNRFFINIHWIYHFKHIIIIICAQRAINDKAISCVIFNRTVFIIVKKHNLE